jgi:DegV family protein with EDD domain
MTIAIVSDSTCDLPAALVTEYNITVLPLYIHIGERDYRDGIDMTRQAFYEGLPDFDVHPTTATPGVGVFTETYQRLVDEGASEILSIHISESLSAIVNVARMAAADFSAAPVTVLDSGQLSLGIGFQVLAAARAAAAGRKLPDILQELDDLGNRTHVFAALDTLEFLKRSGRMNGVMAGLGSLLKIKPILKMHQGVATSERVRTTNGANKRIIELFEALGPLEQVAIVHTHATQKADKLQNMAMDLLPEGTPLSVDITPVIGAHIGPGAAGFACIQRPQQAETTT